MRYGNPSIGSAIDECAPRAPRRSWCSRSIRSTPRARPGRSSTRWPSTWAACGGCRGLRFVDALPRDRGYIRALAQVVNDFWMKEGRGEHLVLSFHGLPKRTLDLGDPYHCQCHATGAPARARARPRRPAVDARVPVALRPCRNGCSRTTGDKVVALAKDGLRRVDVFLSGLRRRLPRDAEEIGIEGRAMFEKAGGRSFARSRVSTVIRRGSPR